MRWGVGNDNYILYECSIYNILKSKKKRREMSPLFRSKKKREKEKGALSVPRAAERHNKILMSGGLHILPLLRIYSKLMMGSFFFGKVPGKNSQKKNQFFQCWKNKIPTPPHHHTTTRHKNTTTTQQEPPSPHNTTTSDYHLTTTIVSTKPTYTIIHNS